MIPAPRIELLNSPSGVEFIPWARRRYEDLEVIRRRSNHPRLVRHYDLGTAFITVEASILGGVVRIEGKGVGTFATFPKATAGYAYPTDEESVSFTVDDVEWEAEQTELLYGNIDWKGVYEDGAPTAVLTWKGPPSRYFPLDPLVSIPGVTTVDEEVGLDTYYTPFGPDIYEAGEAVATAPAVGIGTPKVLGAAYYDGRIVAVIGTNYRGVTNPAGEVGGFFFEAWLLGGEPVRMGYTVSPRQATAWFFNGAGTEAQTVIGDTRHKVVIEEGNATFTQTSAVIPAMQTTSSITTETEVSNFSPKGHPQAPDSSVVFNKTGIAVQLDRTYYASDWQGVHGETTTTTTAGITRAGGERVVAVDYKDSTEVTAKVVLSASTDQMTISRKTWSGYDLAPWIPYTPQSALSVSGPGLVTVGAAYGASGGCGLPYQYSFSHGTIDSEGVVLTVTGCEIPGSIASGTITITDNSGQSAQMTVRLPSGSWVFDSYIFDAPCLGYQCSYCPNCDDGGQGVSEFEEISGTSKVGWRVCNQWSDGHNYCPECNNVVPNYPEVAKYYANQPVFSFQVVLYLWKCP